MREPRATTPLPCSLTRQLTHRETLTRRPAHAGGRAFATRSLSTCLPCAETSALGLSLRPIVVVRREIGEEGVCVFAMSESCFARSEVHVCRTSARVVNHQQGSHRLG